MHPIFGKRQGGAGWAILTGGLAFLAGTGCGGAGNAFEFLGSPFTYVGQAASTGGPGSTGRTTGGATSGSTTFTDPCAQPQTLKFVRISMRNQSPDYVHYSMVLIAFVNSTQYPLGAVCATDISLYTSSGYTSVPAGASVPFGNYCLTGPALYYFHKGGQFQSAATAAGGSLASAIAPAQGTTPTYDGFFTSAGAMVPVPDQILFHNPGSTASGQALKVSRNNPAPCATGTTTTTGDPSCQQDAFYYVDDSDRLAGSTALGFGSGRRVPSEIQGAGCECLGTSDAFQVLSPASSGQGAACNQFFRGGRIDYVFVRDDTDPPFPQLLWRVTDSNGTRVHDFDSRANIR
jgi:hypothetical protein